MELCSIAEPILMGKNRDDGDDDRDGDVDDDI